MKWIRFTLDTHTDAVDMLSYMLDEIGVEGIEIEDHLPLSEEDKKKMFVDILPDPEDNDGTAKVHFYMEPEKYKKEKDSDILIEIDPGIAFGTGSHETTKLCIQALDKYVKTGDSVLDVGCGSGILSIAALKLGAKHATAIDIDEVAVKVAAENMAVNHIPSSDYTLYDGDLISNAFLKVKAGTGHDIVVANILADVIIPLTGVVKPHLKKGGLYITSGIIDTKEAEVREALLENGFEILDVTYMKEWCCFIATI